MGGTAVAGAHLLITGANVKNHSLTGADIKNASIGASALSALTRRHLKGNRGPAGPQGATGAPGPSGPQGPAGTGITTASVTGSDQTNYVDLTPLATYMVPAAGDYVAFTPLTVHNTGAGDEYLNCGYNFEGILNGAGVSTTAGSTASGTSVGAFSADGSGTLEFVCQGSGATSYDISNIKTSYDISNIKMRIHFLALPSTAF